MTIENALHEPNHIDPDDLDNNLSANPSMHDVLAARLHRRHVLKGGVGAMAMASLGTLGMTACATGPGMAETPTLGFKAVGKAITDRVTVPEGYTATVIPPQVTRLTRLCLTINTTAPTATLPAVRVTTTTAFTFLA